MGFSKKLDAMFEPSPRSKDKSVDPSALKVAKEESITDSQLSLMGDEVGRAFLANDLFYVEYVFEQMKEAESYLANAKKVELGALWNKERYFRKLIRIAGEDVAEGNTMKGLIGLQFYPRALSMIRNALRERGVDPANEQ